jgi:hypothetical protein
MPVFWAATFSGMGMGSNEFYRKRDPKGFGNLWPYFCANRAGFNFLTQIQGFSTSDNCPKTGFSGILLKLF